MEIEEIEEILNGTELSRNKNQILAVFAIYGALTYIDMNEPVDVEGIISGLTGKDYNEADYFLKATLVYTIKNINDEIKVFNDHMRKWKFDRLNRVEQAILLLAYTHFFYVDEKIDKRIVIDVAVRLAKTYLFDDDYKFVNAILDNVLVR